jgi:hypothetical protein
MGTILAALIGLGGFLAWRGYANRNGPTEPAGVDKGTPMREWPKATDGRVSVNCLFARSWKAFLVGGLGLAVLGIAGSIMQVVNEVTAAPSRNEIMDVISSNPNNTLDRDEITCMLDSMEAIGFDITSGSEDELITKTASATAAMSDEELDEFNDCLDEESRARGADRAASMSDEQLRQFFIEALVAARVDPVSRSTAECIVNLLEERAVLRDLITAADEPSADLEAALIESETICP